MREAIVLWMLLVFAPLGGAAQDEGPEARVWMDRGDEPVLQSGERVRVRFRISEDAFASVFHIDTDGRVSLLFPQHPGVDPFVRGGRDHRVWFPSGEDWRVDEDPGVGYFFVVASPEPLDLSSFVFRRASGWNLGSVGNVVYEDPYLAMDEFIARMIPDWEFVPYALDFATYHVGRNHEYPRFLCYDCHTYQAYSSWNPYDASCSTYRVVIWDDPYFYARFRYVGNRVVFARPIPARPRYAVAVRGAGDGWAPLVRVREAPVTRGVRYKEDPTRVSGASVGRGGRSAAALGAVGVGPSGPVATLTQEAPRRDQETPRRSRPSDGARGGGGSGRTEPSEPQGGDSSRPTLRRRPRAPSDGEVRPDTTRPRNEQGALPQRPTGPRSSSGGSVSAPRPRGEVAGTMDRSDQGRAPTVGTRGPTAGSRRYEAGTSDREARPSGAGGEARPQSPGRSGPSVTPAPSSSRGGGSVGRSAPAPSPRAPASSSGRGSPRAGTSSAPQERSRR